MPDHEKGALRATYAELYDRLAPLLFEPYAGYLASMVKALKPRSEIAAGAGILTHALAQVLSAEVIITATDLNQPMIDRARAKFPGTRITWQQADAMQLPFTNGSFEFIVCQFGVMFFPDKRASFREAARVLTPGGRYPFAVWDDWKNMPEAPLAIAAVVVAAMFGLDPATLVNPPYHDKDRLREDLAAAQFQQIKVEQTMLPAPASSAREAALATVHGSLIRTVIDSQHPGRLEEATKVVEHAPYADLLAIYNALAEKPVTRFDTRGNGGRRTEALLEARGLTLAEAARMAEVVLQDGNAIHETGQMKAGDAPPVDDVEPDQPEAGSDSVTRLDEPAALIAIEAVIVPFVNAFVREMMKSERPAFLTTFLRKLEAGRTAPSSTTTKREGGMTPSQHNIVDLCTRPEGATGKELAEGCGWPSIAARATFQKLADRFGYDLHENPRGNGRGITFRMTAKVPAEEQA